MQTSLTGIAKKAKQSKKHRFGNLYGMLNKEALLQAWKDNNKKAAAGVDMETATEFEKNLEANLDTLVEELKSKRYKARLVKRVYIPKGNGLRRPLGLPALRDKIVQKAVVSIMKGINSLAHMKWNCKYHIVFAPKYRRQAIFGGIKKDIGEILRKFYVIER